MAGYIYLPVVTDEMKAWGHSWQEGQKEKRKQPYSLLERNRSGGALSHLSSGDKLYILAHGRNIKGQVYINQIGARRLFGLWPQLLDAPGLSHVLLEEGLIKSFLDLRVFACGSGFGVPTMPSFAQKLKSEMILLGYSAIRVTGYLQDVSPKYTYQLMPGQATRLTHDKHKAVWDELVNDSYPASSRKVVF